MILIFAFATKKRRVISYEIIYILSNLDLVGDQFLN